MVKKKLPSELFEKALKDLFSFFQSNRVEYLIIGGIAVSFLGRPRLTQDIDALIFLDSSLWERFLKNASQFSFIPRISNALVFAKRTRIFLLKHAKTDIDVDISLAALPFEEESMHRKMRVRLGKLSIPLPTPEDLIIMKAVAHRSQDIADIESVVLNHPKLDLKRVRKWVREFAKALETPELIGDLEKILKKRP